MNLPSWPYVKSGSPAYDRHFWVGNSLAATNDLHHVQTNSMVCCRQNGFVVFRSSLGSFNILIRSWSAWQSDAMIGQSKFLLYYNDHSTCLILQVRNRNHAASPSTFKYCVCANFEEFV